MPSSLYVIYARRSSETEDRQVLSLESQLDELRKLATLRGIEVTEELTESASARDPGRPVFNDLLHRVKTGKVQGILVWRLDRLARNMVDAGQIIYEVTEGRLIEIVAPEGTYTNTSDSKFMMTMVFGAAAKYADDLSSAVKRGRSTTFARGKVPGPVPLGYTKTHEHELVPGAGTVIPDPERFDIVKRLWTEALDGATNVSELWRKARDEWQLTTRPTKSELARPIALTNVYAILRNPFYCGLIKRGSEQYRGEHAPMVTQDQFKRLQETLGSKRGAPAHHPMHEFVYHGLLHCGACGRLFCGERHEKGEHVYVYYRCDRRRAGYDRCEAPVIREDAATEGIAELLDHVHVDPTIRDWAFEAIAWWAEDGEITPEKLTNRAKHKLARAEAELVTITDMVIRSLLTIEEYKVRRINQLAKIEHLREALAEPVEKLATWRVARDEMRANGLRLGDEFRNGDDLTKRKILSRTCLRVVVLDGKLHFELRTPFVIRTSETDLQSGLSTRETLS